MPELPEVEVCARNLRRWSSSKRIIEATVLDAGAIRRGLSSRPSDRCEQGALRWKSLVGEKSCGIERFGKRIRWNFEDSVCLLHLGMTGKWVCRSRQDAAPRFAKLNLVMEDGAVLWYLDPRRFGCVAFVEESEAAAALVGEMGPDALHEPLDGHGLHRVLSGRRSVKNALMDQKNLAGVGNIQALEALWRAGIDPTRSAGSVSVDECQTLARELLAQLLWTIAAEDEGEIRYISEKGSENPFQVYGRAGESCTRCNSEIVSRKDSGRTSFWCGTCQS